MFILEFILEICPAAANAERASVPVWFHGFLFNTKQVLCIFAFLGFHLNHRYKREKDSLKLFFAQDFDVREFFRVSIFGYDCRLVHLFNAFCQCLDCSVDNLGLPLAHRLFTCVDITLACLLGQSLFLGDERTDHIIYLLIDSWFDRFDRLGRLDRLDNRLELLSI